MRESTTSTYVTQYAEDNQAFINDFAAAFVKMVKVCTLAISRCSMCSSPKLASILASKSHKP
jgi:hypothetical protein